MTALDCAAVPAGVWARGRFTIPNDATSVTAAKAAASLAILQFIIICRLSSQRFVKLNTRSACVVTIYSRTPGYGNRSSQGEVGTISRASLKRFVK
jgi:hypothetical protein